MEYDPKGPPGLRRFATLSVASHAVVRKSLCMLNFITFLVTVFLNSKKQSNEASVQTPQTTQSAEPVDPFTLPLLQGLPAWKTGQNVSMHVYFSTSPTGDVFGVANRKNWGQAELDPNAGVFPHWTWTDIQFGDWKEERREDVNIEIPWVGTVNCGHRVYSSFLLAIPLSPS